MPVGVYDDVLIRGAGALPLNPYNSQKLTDSHILLTMTNDPNQARMANKEDLFAEIPTTMVMTYNENSKANQWITEFGNGSPQTDGADNPKVYYPFNSSGSLPNQSGNWIEVKWTWEDAVLWDASKNNYIPNLYYVSTGSATEWDILETWTWVSDGETRVWTKETTDSQNSPVVNYVFDPSGVWSDNSPISSLTYTLKVSNMVLSGSEDIEIGVYSSFGGVSSFHNQGDARLHSQIISAGTFDDGTSIIPPLFGYVKSEVQAIRANYNTPATVGLLSTSPFSTSEPQVYMRSNDDIAWLVTPLGGQPYDGLWMNESGRGIAWKQDTIVDLSLIELNKNGNINDILTSTWNLRCLETLE